MELSNRWSMTWWRQGGEMESCRSMHMPIIDVLCEVRLKISRNTSHEHIARELETWYTSASVYYRTNTYLSSVTQQDSNVTNPFSDNLMTMISYLPSSACLLFGSKTAQSCSRCPKGSTHKKKWKYKITCDACSIWTSKKQWVSNFWPWTTIVIYRRVVKMPCITWSFQAWMLRIQKESQHQLMIRF